MKSPLYYAQKYVTTWMGFAEEAAKASKATRLQVGCAIYLNNHMLVTGWNGQPCNHETEVCEEDGETLPSVLHAEFNALKKLFDSGNLDSAKGGIVFLTHQPCLRCSERLHLAGIQKVFYKNEYRSQEGVDFLRENGIEVQQYNNETT